MISSDQCPVALITGCRVVISGYRPCPWLSNGRLPISAGQHTPPLLSGDDPSGILATSRRFMSLPSSFSFAMTSGATGELRYEMGNSWRKDRRLWQIGCRLLSIVSSGGAFWRYSFHLSTLRFDRCMERWFHCDRRRSRKGPGAFYKQLNEPRMASLGRGSYA